MLKPQQCFGTIQKEQVLEGPPLGRAVASYVRQVLVILNHEPVGGGALVESRFGSWF